MQINKVVNNIQYIKAILQMGMGMGKKEAKNELLTHNFLK